MTTADDPSPGQRLLSLDVLRGLTIAGMILVTDPGTYSARFAPLAHAEWNGATLADLIFPCFLLMTGVSMALSFGARLSRGASRGRLMAHTLRRSLGLIVLGLLVNGFPSYDLAHLRLPGILQRIGVCYLVAACVYLPLQSVSRRGRMLIVGAAAVVCLGVYGALLLFYPVPGYGAGHLDSLRSLPAVVDRRVFAVRHLWAYGLTPGHGVTYDPEGLLSSVPALVTVLCGVLAGEGLREGGKRQRQCGWMAFAGTVLWLAGLGLSRSMVLNKRIYTPTFALFSIGLCLLLLAGLFYLIDVRRVRRGWTLLLIFGTNAIFAFVMSSVITTLLIVIRVSRGGRQVGLYTYVYEHVFAGWRLPAEVSSLLYAVAIVLLNALLMYPLYRRRVFFKL